jgi:hypothetical protein
MPRGYNIDHLRLVNTSGVIDPRYGPVLGFRAIAPEIEQQYRELVKLKAERGKRRSLALLVGRAASSSQGAWT